MSIVRSVFAVVLWYFIFASCAFAFFWISGQPPHEVAPLPVMLESIALGMVAALLGGYVAARLAGRRPLLHGLAVATVLAIGAAFSLLATLGKGAIWSQVAALVLMAPCAVAGGWLRARQANRV